MSQTKDSKGLSFRIIKNRDLSELEYTEILELCSQAFKKDYRPFMELFPSATHILGNYQNLLVTYALWVTRWLQPGDSSLLRTAYIEGVATDESYRRRGFATALMLQLAHEIMDFDLGALSTGSPGFYTRLGWQLWQGPLYIRIKEKLISTPSDSAMILRLERTPAFDLGASLSAEWREGELW